MNAEIHAADADKSDDKAEGSVLPLMFQLFKKKLTPYDVTIFQTPCFGEDKGYEMVYRTEINGRTHEDVIRHRVINIESGKCPFQHIFMGSAVYFRSVNHFISLIFTKARRLKNRHIIRNGNKRQNP